MQLRELWALVVLTAAACCGVVACGGCSSPHGATMMPPPGDGNVGNPGDPDGGGPPPPPPSDAGPVSGTLRVDPVNPRYFTAGNGVVYLTGSHTWGNFKDRAAVDPPPAFDYNAFLDFMVAHRHNFFRLWTWEQPHSADNVLLYFTPFAWARTGSANASDGKPQFDLNHLDQAYFDRLRARVVAARDRGIYVAIMLFDGWDLANSYSNTGGFPLAAGNNINGVATTPDEFLSMSKLSINTYQKQYVRMVIQTVNDLDNVLYEIANETNRSTATIAWQYDMIRFVHQTEFSLPKQHPVGMTSTYTKDNPNADSDTDLYASGAEWISPKTQLADGDGRKVVLNDTDHSFGWEQLQSAGALGQRQWAWETFCRGAAPVFMDPYLEAWTGRNSPSGTTPDPQWNGLRDALGYTALFASKIDLEQAVPSTSLCSTTYCLVQPGHQYLVYQPDPGGFQLQVTAGSYHVEWFDPVTGQLTDGDRVTLPTGSQSFTPPASFTADAVLLLRAP